ASDTGGAIKGQKVDLYTGHGRGSMRPAMRLNMRTLTIADAGRFEGCPPSWDQTPSQSTLMASVGSTAVPDWTFRFPLTVSKNIRQSPIRLHSGYWNVAGRFFSKKKCPTQAKP